jgi:hypothetical protein
MNSGNIKCDLHREKTFGINRSGPLILIGYWPPRAGRLIGEADHPDSSLSFQNLFIFSDLASMVVFYFFSCRVIPSLFFVGQVKADGSFGLGAGNTKMNFVNISFPDVWQLSARSWPTPGEEDRRSALVPNLRERVS